LKTKNILIAFIVLLLLGAYYYFFEIRKKAADDFAKNKAELLLPEFTGLKVVEMEIEGNYGTIVLKKTGSVWNIIKPIAAPADTQVCENALSMLALAKYASKIDGISAVDFGFNEPELKFKLIEASGREQQLIFGPATPAHDNTYVMADGNTNTVYVVPVSLKFDLNKKISDWQYKEPKKPAEVDNKED
jgi:hypothetical protein